MLMTATRSPKPIPFNPNGSPAGIAGLCSPDGRHLAMMPHPERTVLPWQWGWMPEQMKKTLAASPWLRMFQNAREWCEAGGKSTNGSERSRIVHTVDTKRQTS